MMHLAIEIVEALQQDRLREAAQARQAAAAKSERAARLSPSRRELRSRRLLSPGPLPRRARMAR